MTVKNLTNDIENYVKSVEEGLKSREKIIDLLSEDGSLTIAKIADIIGISSKAVEKHLANLKSAGLIQRIGPDKGGHWQVLKKL